MIKYMIHYVNVNSMQSQKQDECLSLYLYLTFLFFLLSCQVRNHMTIHSKFIFSCHMMLLMIPLWINMFYLDRYT
jgi:hypothetical protein